MIDININIAYIFAILLIVLVIKLYIEGTGKGNNWLSYLFDTNTSSEPSEYELSNLRERILQKINDASESGYIEGFAGKNNNTTSEPSSQMHSKQEIVLDSVLTKSDNKKLMLFYKAGCPYCEDFLPTWYTIINNLPNNVAYEEIEVTSGEKSRKLASQYKITAVPTLILLVNNVQVPFNGKKTYNNVDRFLSKNGVNLIKRSFNSFEDIAMTAELEESGNEPVVPKNPNCPAVTFDKQADIPNDKFYFQIFNEDGPYGYAVGGNRSDNMLTPFGAAYSVVDSYLSSLPDLDNPGQSTMANASECANMYAEQIKSFGLCDNEQLDKIAKYQEMVAGGSARQRVKGTDYSSNDIVIDAIKSACQI